MTRRFEGIRVLVTGASRGIGKAIALAFAQEGARVGVHYHQNLEAAERTLAELPGGPHALLQADLSDPRQAERLMSQAVEALGTVQVLVNNAGIYEHHPLAEISFDSWREAWDRTLNANLLGPAHLTYWASRHMIEQGGGKIVNISSRGAFRGEPSAPAYAASKAGLNAMSQSLAQTLGPHGVARTASPPGWVATDMALDHLQGPGGDAVRAQSPLGRVAEPEEIANVTLFLAGPGTDFLTGCIVDVNGASYLRS